DEEVGQTLYELVKDIPNVTDALVWMYSLDPDETTSLVQTGNQEMVRIFHHLEAEGHVQTLIEQLDARQMQPITIQLGGGQKDPLNPLFKGLRGQQLMVVPIMDSARLIGGVIASIVNNRQYNSEDAKLLCASLAHAAALALERTTLIENMA